VVLPLPRNPVSTVTGNRFSSPSIPSSLPARRVIAIIAYLPSPLVHIKNYHRIWEEVGDRLPN
jgi:hypothetical protein